MLEDGAYDTVVVDARGENGTVVLELAIAAGAHRGEVVTVRSRALLADPLSLLGLPATLTVAGGEPRVEIG